MEALAREGKDWDEKAGQLQSREEALRKKEGEIKSREEEVTKGIEELKNRKQEEVSEKREERDEQERDAANGAANDFDMDANNMSGTGAEDRQSPDAEPMGAVDMNKDFGYNAAQFSPPQALNLLRVEPAVDQALASTTDHDISVTLAPSLDQNAVGQSLAFTNTVQANVNSTAQLTDKDNVSPPSTLSPSLAAPLAGQKRSAEEVEEEASQDGTNKRSKLAEDATQSAKLDSAISIITAASASEPIVPFQPTSFTSPADDTVATSLDNLLQQEVASIRALLGPKRSESQTPAVNKEEVKDDKEEAAFGRVRVSLENYGGSVEGDGTRIRGLDAHWVCLTSCDVIGRKADGRFTCSAPEEKMLVRTAGTSESQSTVDEVTPAQETTLQTKIQATGEEAKALAEGESLVFKATRKVNGRLLYAIVVE
ncbi:hypothetical protein QFC20_007790 [Naganishia adeliensis]|uniref:Uncharacterized protein n=1 Tax=Naganishia adeliensis TaxID=92952 RepID=A0ACC2UVC9_9TREE|nr:hypothetical protein QFC20_007790 [Naganishia adeliensis]